MSSISRPRAQISMFQRSSGIKRTTFARRPCCNSSSSNSRSSHDGDETAAAIASSPRSTTMLSIADVERVVADAERHFLNDSSRIEYCRFHGVDFERANEYLPIIKKMTASLQKVNAQWVRIEGVSETTYDALVEAGVCPLCNRTGHVTSMCPLLPDEMRPFF